MKESTRKNDKFQILAVFDQNAAITAKRAVSSPDHGLNCLIEPEVFILWAVKSEYKMQRTNYREALVYEKLCDEME